MLLFLLAVLVLLRGPSAHPNVRTDGFQTSQNWSALTYQIEGSFRVTGAATLPNGDVLVLERLFTREGKNAIRLKRVGAPSIFDGAVLDGQLVAELTLPLNIDNFEGVTTRREENGGVIIYLISDDNFNSQQRTLLMVFEIKRN